MITKEQIKREFFISLTKQSHGMAVNDIILPAIIIKDLYKKYQCEITIDEFNDIGDELEIEGYFRWNDDGFLAITLTGLEFIKHNIKTS